MADELTGARNCWYCQQCISTESGAYECANNNRPINDPWGQTCTEYKTELGL